MDIVDEKVQELKLLIDTYNFLYNSKESSFYADESMKFLINDCESRIKKLEAVCE